MAKSTQDSILASHAWNAGEPLCWSVEKYASLDSRQRVEMLRNGEFLTHNNSDVAVPAGFETSNVAAVLKIGVMAASFFYPPDRKDVIDQLITGKLFGIGFKTPRELTDAPVRIPNRVWTGKVDFGIGSVSGIGFTFVDVRVVSASDWPTPPMALQLQPKMKEVGRPGSKAEIFAAIESENAENSVCATYREIGRVERIRKRLSMMYPEQLQKWRELDDESINKYRRTFCATKIPNGPATLKATQ